mmetsp:Transcript_325/g.1097  ORF Transcript_325/g.1097 Transcript_325/m.1097 type:complete len:216 (+) Transcript_325:1266-1913(+)
MLNHFSGDNVADVFSIITPQDLKRDSDALHVARVVRAEARAARIPWVYCCIDLDCQQVLGAARTIVLHVDAAHHADGDTRVVAADGKSHNRDLVLQVWKLLLELDRRQRLPEHRILYRQQSQVALQADAQDPCDVLLMVAPLADLHHCSVSNYVCIGEQPTFSRLAAGDCEGRAGLGVLGLVRPGQRVVRLGDGREDLHDAVHAVVLLLRLPSLS